MRICLAVSSGRARAPVEPIDESLMDVVMPREAGPWRRHDWNSRDNRTWLVAWSNEPDDPRLPSPLRSNGEAAVECPGYVGNPGDIERLLRDEEPGTTADELSGVFGVFRADQRGFQAITTAVRLHPVYYASAEDLHIAGNRALLVHAVARGAGAAGKAPTVSYAVPGLHAFVRSGYFVSDDTPFEGVRALPAHSTLEVRGGARRIVTRTLPSADPSVPKGPARRVLMEGFVESLKATTAPLREFSEQIWLSLTGGRDSRLIAAALHASGMSFRASTSGFPDHPDVVLAEKISRLLEVEHRSSAPRRDESGDALVVKHPLRRAWEVIRFTEGMISAHNNVTRPMPFRISPRISGAGGEQLRGGFLANQSRAEAEAMRKRVRDLFMVSEELLTDAANERARQDLAPWMEHARRDPMDALDRIYLYYRSGRWSAAARATSMAGHPTFNLLFDNCLNRRALAMSPRFRWSERPFHEAIAQLAPALTNLPLTGKRWRYDEAAPPWPFRRTWMAREPLCVDREGAGFDWRNQPDPALLRLLREQILGGPSELFEIVKRPRLEALLSRPTLQKSAAVFVWNVLTASVLLSGAWLAPAPSVANIEIPLPPRARHGGQSPGDTQDRRPIGT
jgi:hypothetical protein